MVVPSHPWVIVHAPGCTTLTTAALGVITAPTDARVRDHGAQYERIPWVGEKGEPQNLKGVSLPMGSVQETSALPCEKHATIG